MNKHTKRNGIILLLICALCFSMVRFDAACEEMRENVFRLHILANSDSSEDQACKLAVRDAILAQSDLFAGCVSEKEAEGRARQQLEFFRQTAQQAVFEQGFSYPVSVSVGPSYFENREYDNFTLPAGVYSSLIVRLGEAKGHNWWCVMFPAVCVGSATLGDALSEESEEIAENRQNYEIRFKTVEIFENFRHKITGK